MFDLSWSLTSLAVPLDVNEAQIPHRGGAYAAPLHKEANFAFACLQVAVKLVSYGSTVY